MTLNVTRTGEVRGLTNLVKITEAEALKAGMEQKAREFVEAGAEDLFKDVTVQHARFVLQDRHGNQADCGLPKISRRLRRIRGGAARCEHPRRNAGRSARKFEGSGRDGFAGKSRVGEFYFMSTITEIFAPQTTAEPPAALVAIATELLDGTAPSRWKTARDAEHTVVEVDAGWKRRLVFSVRHGENVSSGGKTHTLVGSKSIEKPH